MGRKIAMAKENATGKAIKSQLSREKLTTKTLREQLNNEKLNFLAIESQLKLEKSNLELIKYACLLAVCVSLMISFPFPLYDGKRFPTKVPSDAIILLLCFGATVFFDLLHKRKEFSKSNDEKLIARDIKILKNINALEILICILFSATVLFFYTIEHERALSAIVFYCAVLFFCLNVGHLFFYLFVLKTNFAGKKT